MIFALPIKLLLWGFLAFDVLIIDLYVTHNFFEEPANLFSTLSDWSGGEIFNYLKEFLLFVVLLLLVKRWGQPVFVAWSLIFFYLLADDALGLHELFGVLLFQLLPFETFAGVHFRNVGEFLFFLLAGSVLMIFLRQAHQFSSRQARAFTWSLLPWLILLVSCGMMVDAIHVFVMQDHAFDVIFTVLEDGGEMVVLSLMLWKTISFYCTEPRVQRQLRFSK